MPTQHGSGLYKGHGPNVDAGVVAVCRAAGALILGKTVSGQTRNHGDGDGLHRALRLMLPTKSTL